MVTLLHLPPQIIKFLPGRWPSHPTLSLPEGGSYPDRTFDFRLSATVEVEKSSFTDLTGYHQILMPLDASISLTYHRKEVVSNLSSCPDGGEITI